MPNSAETPTEARYYHLSTRHLSWMEILRLSRNPLRFPILALIKVLRLRVSNPYAVRYPVQLHICGPEDLSDEARAAFDEIAEEWAAEGFREAFRYRLDTLGQQEIDAACYLSKDGRLLGATVSVRLIYGDIHFHRQTFSCSARLGETMLSCYSERRELQSPPGYQREFWPKARPGDLVDRMHQRCANQPVEIHTPEQLPALLTKLDNAEVRFQIDRGVYIPLTDDELTKMRELVAGPACKRCGDFSKSVQNLEYPGYCQACWNEQAQSQSHNRATKQRRRRILLSIIAGLIATLVMVDTPADPQLKLLILLLSFLITALLAYLLAWLLDFAFGRYIKKVNQASRARRDPS